ncbi:MAG: hypothetical protein LC781_18885 [Actinobacteria bacterium]|nr:hypothetical protein [Actinomycetota bacterium]
MGRRGNGEGSITRRKDGLYMARYTVETATGPKRKAVYAKTRKEVSTKLTAALADASKGVTADGGPNTVGAFLGSWLENTVRGSVRKSTYDRHESLCRVHLIPGLGKKKLKTLSPSDVAGFYRRKLDEGCSAASVHKMHETLHKALFASALLSDPAWAQALSITKSGPAAVESGEEFTYTIIVTGDAGTAKPITVTDKLPKGVAPSSPLPTDCTASPSDPVDTRITVTCTINDRLSEKPRPASN